MRHPVSPFLAATALFALAVQLPAQVDPGLVEDESIFPYHGFLVSGYGSTGYAARFAEGGTPNSFSASLSPVFLFQIRDRFLFESELEFGFEEGVTETSLEYAEILYALSNNFTVGVGKFLLPFNVFSERLHPSWINKLATPPAVYGGGHGPAGPAPALLPVLSDFGVQIRSSFDLGGWWYGTAVAYVTQGPQLEIEEDHAEGEEEEEGHAELPELRFGSSVEDINERKMVGGRLGFGLAPYFEVNLSGMTGAYDPAGDLAFSALGAHLELRHRGFEIHGEATRTYMDLAPETAGEPEETAVRDGYFVQLERRFGPIEPVLRWSQLLEGETDHEVVTDPGRQLALGLAYWLTPAVVLKAEYQLNREEHEIDNDRFALQWAFGF